MDIRFYEVQAKSVLNRVPEAVAGAFPLDDQPVSRLHPCCSFCSWGDAPVLMGDGTARPIADIGRGDEIYGTTRRGNYRRYTKTPVLDHWSTIKPAYRVTLEDGTALVSSGDHRFLSDRGWKYVVNDPRCPDRAHLTLATSSSALAALPRYADDWPDYRRGYLCGLIRGDGHLAL